MVTFCCLYYVFVALLGSQPEIKPADGFVKLSDSFCWQKRGMVIVTSPPFPPNPFPATFEGHSYLALLSNHGKALFLFMEQDM